MNPMSMGLTLALLMIIAALLVGALLVLFVR